MMMNPNSKSAPVQEQEQEANDIFSISDQVLADRLQFIEEIGYGNWGSVWACRPKHNPTSDSSSHAPSGETTIAVKLVHRSKTPTTAARVRSLWNEMKVVRSLKHEPHPSIIPFYSFIITPSYALITMAHHPRLVPVEVAEHHAKPWFRSLLSGVEFLHKRGVVHNDIKPANILLSASNTPVLVDFGFAQKYDLSPPPKSPSPSASSPAGPSKDGISSKPFHSNLSYGTPEYLSPERARGLPHDTRKSDVWSLGVTFFEILVGRTPFEREVLSCERPSGEGGQRGEGQGGEGKEGKEGEGDREGREGGMERLEGREALEGYWERTMKGEWIGTYHTHVSPSMERMLRRMIQPRPELRYDASEALADRYWSRPDDKHRTTHLRATSMADIRNSPPSIVRRGTTDALNTQSSAATTSRATPQAKANVKVDKENVSPSTPSTPPVSFSIRNKDKKEKKEKEKPRSISALSISSSFSLRRLTSSRLSSHALVSSTRTSSQVTSSRVSSQNTLSSVEAWKSNVEKASISPSTPPVSIRNKEHEKERKEKSRSVSALSMSMSFSLSRHTRTSSQATVSSTSTSCKKLGKAAPAPALITNLSPTPVKPSPATPSPTTTNVHRHTASTALRAKENVPHPHNTHNVTVRKARPTPPSSPSKRRTGAGRRILRDENSPISSAAATPEKTPHRRSRVFGDAARVNVRAGLSGLFDTPSKVDNQKKEKETPRVKETARVRDKERKERERKEERKREKKGSVPVPLAATVTNRMKEWERERQRLREIAMGEGETEAEGEAEAEESEVAEIETDAEAEDVDSEVDVREDAEAEIVRQREIEVERQQELEREIARDREELALELERQRIQPQARSGIPRITIRTDPTASSPPATLSHVPAPTPLSPLMEEPTMVYDVVEGPAERESSLSVLRQSLRMSLDVTKRIYKSSTQALAYPWSSPRDSTPENRAESDMLVDEEIVRDAKSSSPILANEQMATVDQVTTWMKNVEKVVEDARQNFAQSSTTTLAPLPVAPISRRSSEGRSNPSTRSEYSSSRAPRRILAANHIFTQEPENETDGAPVEYRRSWMKDGLPVPPALDNAIGGSRASMYAKLSDGVKDPVTPRHRRRATILSRSPEKTKTMLDLDLELSPSKRREKSKSQNDLQMVGSGLGRAITPVTRLEFELEQLSKPAPVPRLASLVDPSLFIGCDGARSPRSSNFGGETGVKVDNDLTAEPHIVEPYPARPPSKASLALDSTPGKKHLEGVYDRFLMSTTGVKRVGRGYQSETVGLFPHPQTQPSKTIKNKRSFLLSSRKPIHMPPPVSSDDMRHATSFDEFGIKVPSSASTSTSKSDKSEDSTGPNSTVSIVRRALKAITVKRL